MVQEQKHLSIGELYDLRSKVAAITGGASGMGFASARRLAEAGAAVLLADINLEGANKKTEELADSGYKVNFVKCDVTQESDVANMVDTAVKTFGGLDIMVNNAGIYPLKTIAEMNAETWDRIMKINMRGLFFCCLKAS